MLVLALPQIYTSVFHLWKSIDLNSAWVRCSFRSQVFFLPRALARLEIRHTRVLGAGIPTNASPNFLKMLLLALPQIYTRVFHFWKSIDLDSAWVKDCRHYHLSFLS